MSALLGHLARAARAAVRSVDVRVSAALTAVTMALTALFMEMWAWNINVPQGGGGDLNLAGMIVKGIEENGGYQENPNLAWPFGFKLYDLPIGDDNLNLLLMRVISWFAPNYAVVMNVFMFLTFPLVAVCAYFVARRLGVSQWPAVMVGLLYTFLPYHFRGQVFLLLIGYWALPFGLLLAIRIFQGVPLFARRPGVSGWRSWASRRSVATVATCIAMGSTGLYLAAFATVVILLATGVQLLRRSGRRAGVTGAVALALLMATVVVNVSPSILYRAQNGTNTEVAVRGEGESEIYGLTLTRMVIPPTNHRFGPAREFGANYQVRTALPLAGEQSSYVGIVNGVAFLGLLLMLVFSATVGAAPGTRRRYGPLAAGAVIAFVFGIIGGLNTIFSFVAFPVLRGTGRISVAIAFFTLIAVALALDSLRGRLRAANRLWAFPGIVLAITTLGLYDQTGTDLTSEYHKLNEAAWTANKKFVQAVEASVPQGTAVYTMPEQLFPEAAGPLGVADYDSALGYLHSKSLRWSYGATKGREGAWLVSMSGVGMQERLNRVSACGFGAVMLDRAGYADPAATSAQVAALTGSTPVVSADGRREFYSLADFNRRLASVRPPEVKEDLCERTLHPLQPTPGPGFGIPETDGVVNWRTLARESEFGLENVLNEPRSVRIRFLIATLAAEPTPVAIELSNGTKATAVAGAAYTEVAFKTVLKPGMTTVKLAAALPDSAFGDPDKAFRVDGLILRDAS